MRGRGAEAKEATPGKHNKAVAVAAAAAAVGLNRRQGAMVDMEEETEESAPRRVRAVRRGRLGSM